MNPRAAINDLHPFQGCPFSHLGYFSKYSLPCIPYKARLERYLQRRGWDSNPRALADKRFSRPPRYDHFDTSPGSQFAFLSVSAKVILPKMNFSVNPFFSFCNNFFLWLFSSIISPNAGHFKISLPQPNSASAITKSSGVVILMFS